MLISHCRRRRWPRRRGQPAIAVPCPGLLAGAHSIVLIVQQAGRHSSYPTGQAGAHRRMAT